VTDADDAAGQFADELAGDLLKHLAVHADPSRAESERAYLKSQRDFLGVSVPASRGVVRTFVREHGPFSMEQVVELVDSLWDGPGRLADSNAAQVRRVRSILDGLSLEIATPDEARQMLQLKGRGAVGF